MKQSGFTALFMLLLTSNRSASSAFISGGDFINNNNRFLLPGVEPKNMQVRPSKDGSSFGRLEKSVNQAQSVLEDFSHKYINQRSNNNGTNGRQVTFFKLKGTESYVYYGKERVKGSCVPRSIAGKFDTFRKMEEDESLASPYIFSTGTKSFGRALEKILQNPEKEVRDLARLSVVTKTPDELYEFCKYICDYHNKSKESSPFAIDKDSPVILRGWSQKDSGFFSAKLNVPIKTDNGKVYAEIMLVPEHKKSRMAVDVLSHTAYEVARKDSTNSYSSEALRKWNIVVSKAKNSDLVNLNEILDREVQTKKGFGPVTANDFDIYTMKSLFSGYGIGKEKPIERRKKEMTQVQKELNKRVMGDICSDENWNPLRIESISKKYSFPENMVNIEPVKKYEGCEIDYARLR